MTERFIKQNWALFLLLILPATFLCIWMPQLIFHPNDILLTGDGDGLKSYYCFYFHTHFDDTLLHFSGMNYPHGEHYLFTDGFPLFAWLVQILPFLKPYGIALIHISLVLSLWLTPLFIYLTLKKFKTETWIALLGSLSLFLLQPQFPRLFSHLSLAYSIFFPLSWYLLIRYKENPGSIKWIIVLIINQLFWYFMHPYLGFMITLFYGIDWTLQLTKKVTWKERITVLIPVALPAIVVQLFLKWTDDITDRPINPYGFFEYQAHWKSIFVPPIGSIHRWMETFVTFNEVQWEGQAYLGYLTILMLLVGMFIGIPRFRKHFSSIGEMQRNLLVYIIGAGILLILSFGFPFNGNPDWLDFLPFLKQFRALGRFSWPFYYVAGVFGIVSLSIFYRRLSNKNQRTSYFAAAVVSLLLGLQITESWNLLSIPETYSPNLFQLKNLTAGQKLLISKSRIGKNQYDAILPMPWFHVGSETYGKEATREILLNSFLISAHTGIPINAVMMGRTSQEQTRQYFQFFNLKENHRLDLNHSLLLVHPSENGLYAEDEQLIYDESKPYFKNKLAELKIIKKQRRFWEDPYSYQEVVRDKFNDKNHWGEQIKNGRFNGLIENYNTILSVDSTKLMPNQWYDLSFDYYPDWSKPIANVCYLEYIHPETKAVSWFYTRSIGSFPGISKKVIRVNLSFKTQNFPCEYHCFLVGNLKNVRFEIDHLTLKKRLK